MMKHVRVAVHFRRQLIDSLRPFLANFEIRFDFERFSTEKNKKLTFWVNF